MNPKEKLAALLKGMQAIVDGAKALGRELTDEELGALETKNTEVVELKATIARQEKGSALLRSLSEDEAPASAAVPDVNPWAQKAVEGIREVTKGVGKRGSKALVSGTLQVPPILGAPITIDAAPRTLLDLIPVAVPRGTDDDDYGNTFATIRQNTRTNNAGAVPDGEEKPTSIYTFGQIDDTYRVYANKTEDLPWRFLDDFSGLVKIVTVQLVDDTKNAMERDVLSGDGEDDRFLGLLNTSGLGVQAYTTDLLTTISNAKYGFLANNRPLTAWVLNPLDVQKLEQLRENGATGAFLFKSRTEIESYLGARYVTSSGIAEGTALAGEWSQAELLPVGDDELILDTKNRTKDNTFLMMFEGRYGFRVKKPSAFTKITLSA